MNGNILSFKPPNFGHILNIKFPDSRLPVCKHCKKNYKSRSVCRIRSGHTDLPWSTTHICITLDDSCTDADGKIVDVPLTARMIHWQPFCAKKPFTSEAPICAACKKTKHTQTFCREQHQHRQLPWCTVFVILGTVETTDRTSIIAAPSIPLEPEKKPEDAKDAANDKKQEHVPSDSTAEKVTPAAAVAPSPPPILRPKIQQAAMPKITEVKVDKDSDTFDEIDKSRTFLITLSINGICVNWLDLPADAVGPNEADIVALNKAIRTPQVSPAGPFGDGSTHGVRDESGLNPNMNYRMPQHPTGMMGYPSQYPHPYPPQGHMYPHPSQMSGQWGAPQAQGGTADGSQGGYGHMGQMPMYNPAMGGQPYQDPSLGRDAMSQWNGQAAATGYGYPPNMYVPPEGYAGYYQQGMPTPNPNIGSSTNMGVTPQNNVSGSPVNQSQQGLGQTPVPGPAPSQGQVQPQVQGQVPPQVQGPGQPQAQPLPQAQVQGPPMGYPGAQVGYPADPYGQYHPGGHPVGHPSVHPGGHPNAPYGYPGAVSPQQTRSAPPGDVQQNQNQGEQQEATNHARA